MTNIDRYEDKPAELIQVQFEWTVEDIKHFWFAIADYNGYRVKEGGEPLSINHPLMRAQYRITASIDDMIATGMREGKMVGPLLDIKSAISGGDELEDA